MSREMNHKIIKAFMDVQKEFPFQDYMRYKLHKYMSITQLIKREVSFGSRILDVGCGPCDLTAILSRLGYDLTCVDDLRDPWRLVGTNRERIRKFAEKFGIKLTIERLESVQLRMNEFDAILLIDVIEHTTAPRYLLNRVLSALKPNGLLIVESPNHAALAKRVRLMVGKSVYTDADFIFLNVGEYRGHIREYTISELLNMLRAINLTEVRTRSVNTSVKEVLHKTRGFQKAVTKMYDLISQTFPGFRDTVLVWGKKPENWFPLDDSFAIRDLKKYYPQLAMYNLENENDDTIILKLSKKDAL